MLVWFFRKARKNYVCGNCDEVIEKGEMYIGRRTYGGIATYCVSCCPDKEFIKKVRKYIKERCW